MGIVFLQADVNDDCQLVESSFEDESTYKYGSTVLDRTENQGSKDPYIISRA